MTISATGAAQATPDEPSVDFYFSFRSPFSYLAAVQIMAARDAAAPRFDMRVVRPLAVRNPDIFTQAHPLWEPYLRRDAQRVAERLAIPFAWPTPDPVATASQGGFAEAQPRIDRLNRIGVAAAEAGRGLEAIAAVAELIWSGRPDWDDDEPLYHAVAAAGLDPGWIRQRVERRAQALDRSVIENEAAQAAAGHWGVPLFVFRDEPFFGQDRIADLIWRIRQSGVWGAG